MQHGSLDWGKRKILRRSRGIKLCVIAHRTVCFSKRRELAHSRMNQREQRAIGSEADKKEGVARRLESPTFKGGLEYSQDEGGAAESVACAQFWNQPSVSVGALSRTRSPSH